MDYILIAILAWALFGFSSFIEKVILRKPLKDPVALTFYTGAFAIFSFAIFLPFARFTTWSHLIFDLACGLIFFLAQLFFYKALSKGDLSAVVPITGALIPIFSVAMISAMGVVFYNNELIAILLFILGTVLISYEKKIRREILLPALVSSLFFALYYSFVKIAYTPFAENFAFVRLGTFIFAMAILLEPKYRKEIFKTAQDRKEKFSMLVVGKEILAGIGFIILNYAISSGNPAIVNAMQGIEYAVVFGIALSFSKFDPKFFKEHINDQVLHRRLAAILLILIGLAVLQF